MWQKLRIDPTFIFEGEDSVARFTINLNFPDPINQGQDSWKTKVIILKYHETYKFQPGDNFKYSNEDIKLLRTYSVYQTPKSIKWYVKKIFDIFLILGMSPDKDGDFFILNCRWLRYRNKVLNDDEQHYLWSRIGNKIDMKRKGGSNGNKLDLKPILVKFLHLENHQGLAIQNFGC